MSLGVPKRGALALVWSRTFGTHTFLLHFSLCLGRRRSEVEHHEPCDRSEFYTMEDVDKQPVIFYGDTLGDADVRTHFCTRIVLI